jgi:hypothetical protein
MIRLLRAASPFSGAARQSEGNDGTSEPVPEETIIPDGRADDNAKADAADEAVDLDAGIASIFASIRSGAAGGAAPRDLPEENGATYALLTELDRLWQNA